MAITRTLEYSREQQCADALSESNERFRQVFDEAPIGMTLAGEDFKFVKVNAAFCALIGYTEEELRSLTFRDITHPEDVSENVEHIRKLAAGELPKYYTEKRYVRKDKAVIWASLTVSIFRDFRGGFRYYYAIVVDITERKQRESELSESETLFRTLSETSPIGIFRSDAKGLLTYVNERFMKIAGLPAQEALGTGFLKAVHPDDRIIAETARANIRKEFAIEHRLIVQGAVRWVRVKGKTLFNEKREIIGRVGTAEDITERVRMEEEIRENERRYRTLFENMLNGFAYCKLICDEQGHPVDFVYLSVNRSFERLTGLQNVTNKRATEVIPGIRQDNPELFEIYGRVAMTGRPETFEVYFKPLDCWLSIGVYSPQRGYFVAIFDNITERKQAVEALKESFVRLQESFDDTVTAITKIVETRDPYTVGHQKHVSQLGFAMAAELGLPERQAQGIRIAGLLHDVGKIFIPVEILSKPGRLSTIEFNMIKIHPKAGNDILRTIKFPWPVAEVAYQHQERIDGTGYPHGLHGEEILLETKIISVADTVEAMTFSRPYRAPLGLGKALEQIEKGKGKLYDPQAVDACRRVFKSGSFRFRD